jgi:hypothetical protein
MALFLLRAELLGENQLVLGHLRVDVALLEVDALLFLLLLLEG